MTLVTRAMPPRGWLGLAPAGLFGVVLLATELLLCEIQILSEPTYAFDIDAYMEQAARFLGKSVPPDAAGVPSRGPSLNYTQLTGDTGPIVYPAVHLYLHSALLLATDWDCEQWTTEYVPKNQSGYVARTVRPHRTITAMQQGYVVLFLCLICAAWWSQGLSTVGRRYEGAALAALLFLISRRSRSVAVLGLFNEAWAMALAYLAVFLLSRRRWTAGCVAFALATNTKMNVLLFAPGLLAALVHEGGVAFAARHIALCAAVSALVGVPFLAAAPFEYVSSAFNLGRRFDQQWSVNWRWLSEDVFASPYFSAGLLAAHVGALIAAYAWIWAPMFRAEAARAQVASEEEGGRSGLLWAPDSRNRAASLQPRLTGTRRVLGDWEPDAEVSGPALRHRRRDQHAATVSSPEPDSAPLMAPPSGESDVECGIDSSSAACLSDQESPNAEPDRGTPTAAASASGGPSEAIAFALLSSNILGVVFARSLHFQFHLWYWHTLPAVLAWVLPLPVPAPSSAGAGLWERAVAWWPTVRVGFCHVAFAAALELSWGVHPPTSASSAGVTGLHALLAAGLLLRGWQSRRHSAGRRGVGHARVL